jgi:hypothetical protein
VPKKGSPYFVVLLDKPIAVKVLFSDGPFSMLGIQSYYMASSEGENEPLGKSDQHLEKKLDKNNPCRSRSLDKLAQ